jgi:hypothetical protein
MSDDTTLRWIDLRTHPPTDIPRSAIPPAAIEELIPVIRAGSGAIRSMWWFTRETPYLVHSYRNVPGTAFASSLRKQPQPIVVGGLRFSLGAGASATSNPACLVGWIAWRNGVAEEIGDNIVKTIEHRAAELGSLCPFEEPKLPIDLPWVAVLRLASWRDLTTQEQAALGQLVPCIARAAVDIGLSEQGER